MGCYSLPPTGWVPTVETRGPAWDVVVVVVVVVAMTSSFAGRTPSPVAPCLSELAHSCGSLKNGLWFLPVM